MANPSFTTLLKLSWSTASYFPLQPIIDSSALCSMFSVRKKNRHGMNRLFIHDAVGIGFVFFVANLKKGQYSFQMAQFCYTHMALLLIVVQSHFIVENILEGLIW